MSLQEYCVVEDDGMESSVVWTHRRIGLPEALSLFDTRKKRVATSAPVEFVNARLKRKVLFKKLKEAKEGSFKSENNNGHFEMLKSNIVRHFNRLNGKFLVLPNNVGSKPTRASSVYTASNAVVVSAPRFWKLTTLVLFNEAPLLSKLSSPEFPLNVVPFSVVTDESTETKSLSLPALNTESCWI